MKPRRSPMLALLFSGVSLKQPVPAQAYRFGGS